VLDSLVANLQRIFPSAPVQFWTELRSELPLQELANAYAAAYEKHLTPEDIQALQEFYSTPAGQRFLAAQPLILDEIATLARTWGQTVLEQTRRRLKEKGYTK
jgi:hypothetical protein